MTIAPKGCQGLSLAAETNHAPPFVDGCDKMKQLSGTFHFIRLHERRRWSRRLACSQTANSALKSPSPSCTKESKSPICSSEHHSKRSRSCAPSQSVFSRSMRSCDPASFRWYSNSSSAESPSAGELTKISSKDNYTERCGKLTRNRPVDSKLKPYNKYKSNCQRPKSDLSR
jgi:hypothetical protein